MEDKQQKPEQLYKLKEEVKKYWHGNLKDGHKYTLSEWEAVGWNKEALEPVPERITVQLINPGDKGCTRLFKLEDGSDADWTEQERKDIEHLLNREFEMINPLNEIIMQYTAHCITEHENKTAPYVLDFGGWLKEIYR